MRIEGYSQLANTALVKVSALQSWSIGQIFSATVIGRGDENSILLDVAGQTIRAQSQLPLANGQQLTLRVVNTGPNALLSVVGSASPPQNVIASAMNESLPNQLPMSALSTAVAAAVAQADTASPTATRLGELVRSVIQEIPARDGIDTPQRVQKAIAQSGLLLEATLAAQVQTGSAAPPVDDFKWQLLQLRAALAEISKLSAPPQAPSASGTSAAAPATQAPAPPPSAPGAPVAQTANALQSAGAPPGVPGSGTGNAAPAPLPHGALAPALTDGPLLPKLGQAVDGALARIETHQLNAANAQLSGQVYVVAEIPVRLSNENLEFVRVEIEDGAQDRAAGERDSGLNVVLEVPVTTTQTIAARIRLQEQNVTVTLWSDDEGLQRRIEAQRDELAANLTNAGFHVGSVMLGRVAPIEAGSRLPSRLIDAKV